MDAKLEKEDEFIPLETEPAMVLESETITDYVLDAESGVVIREIKKYYKPKPVVVTPEPYALEAMFVEYGGSPPEGFVIGDKSHIYAKGAVYIKPPKEVE